MDRQNTVSITDIANEAGVSIATVSRILNNKGGRIKISEATRHKVLAAAEKLGYERNPLAAAMRSQRTGIIGALNPNFSGTYMSVLAKHLVQAAAARDVELLVGAPGIDEETLKGQINKLQRMLFDGFILMSDMLGYQAMIRKLAAIQKPYVALSAGQHIPPPIVSGDDQAGTSLAVAHLHQHGHRRMAFLGSSLWNASSERLNAFKAALRARELPIHESYLAVLDDLPYTPHSDDFHARSRLIPMEAAQGLLRLETPPTALLCENDGFAVAAIKGIVKMGLRVPEDVSVVGFGDESIANLFTPELTTIRTPFEELASEAIDLLLAMIADPEDEALRGSRITIAPHLVIRESTGPAPH